MPAKAAAALVARHCTIRPPPGATPPQIERTSAPQAERSTNSSSRGRIGRSTITVGRSRRGRRGGAPAAAGAAPAAVLPHHRRWRRQRPAASRPRVCLVLFQALQRRCAAGRHARADLWIVGAAGAADRGNLRAGRLFRGGASAAAFGSAVSALPSSQPQALRLWPARFRPAWPFAAAPPALRRRAPRSGSPMTGSTCSSAGIAAMPRRPAARWSNAPCNPSGIAT